jgi:hypothetical protein
MFTPIQTARKIPDAQYWTDLRDAYFKAKKGPLDEDDEWLVKAFQEGPSGGLVEYEVRYGEYGRGVFVKQDVPKGTMVWECSRDGAFRNEQQWLDFLSFLPPYMQYDCVQWAYASDGVVYLDLEPGTLFNHGGSAPTTDTPGSSGGQGYSSLRPNNLDSVKNEEEDYWYIANCDIMSGDELLCDYTTFHDYGKPLDWFQRSHDNIVKKGQYYSAD